jgi:hypothetical protein
MMPPTMMLGRGPGVVDPPAGAELSGGGGSRTAATTTMMNNIKDNATAFSGRSCCFELLGYNLMVGSNLRSF